MRLAWIISALLLGGCQNYRDFTLPLRSGAPAEITTVWKANPDPVLGRGAPGDWDSGDVLNPAVLNTPAGYLNIYSGFDGKTWRTGKAISSDGLHWTRQGVLFGPDRSGYIAANGSVVRFQGTLLYYFQSGRTPGIYMKGRQADAVLRPGSYGSWDERGVADPYVIEAGGQLYMFFLGMDRARRQRLGVAQSRDGVIWYKLRANPILELGDYGAFDENGLGEPAVWSSQGSYWMLYTGRARDEQRSLGMARSHDGVAWRKVDSVVLRGEQAWDSRVLCDPSVLVEGNRIRVWFGGGDVARPDENIHGQIGYGELTISPR